MTKEFLNPPDFTKGMGVYSPGIKVSVGDSELIFVTGQVAMDKDRKLVAPGNFGRQTEFIFENIKQILAEGGATLEDVVKATIFVTDMKKYGDVSAVRNKYFATSKPASTLVEISRTVHDGCEVEIEVIAVKKN